MWNLWEGIYIPSRYVRSRRLSTPWELQSPPALEKCPGPMWRTLHPPVCPSPFPSRLHWGQTMTSKRDRRCSWPGSAPRAAASLSDRAGERSDRIAPAPAVEEWSSLLWGGTGFRWPVRGEIWESRQLWRGLREVGTVGPQMRRGGHQIAEAERRERKLVSKFGQNRLQ